MNHLDGFMYNFVKAETGEEEIQTESDPITPPPHTLFTTGPL